MHLFQIWARRLLLIVLVAPLALLWGEVFTRVLLPQNVDSKMNIFAPDPIVGFTYKPNAQTYEKGREYNALYQINSLGLRDREYGVKEEGVFRILLLGDSFSVSHGLPIEESLSRQMEEALQEVADESGHQMTFEVINAAAGGYSPYNYWKAYLRWSPVFNPDAVLIGLSPDDYDCDNEYAQYWIEEGETLAVYKEGETRRPSRKISGRRLRKWLSWHSEFYILLRNFFYYSDFADRARQWKKPKNEKDNSQLRWFMVSEKENMHKAWRKSFSYLQKLRSETEADAIPLVLMSIPLKLEIDSVYFQQTLASMGLNKEQFDLAQQVQAISDFCEKKKIYMFDPREAIQEHNMKVPCYFVYDGHWVSEGIRAAVSSVSLEWRKRRLPPWQSSAN